jgi:hypothetical protein
MDNNINIDQTMQDSFFCIIDSLEIKSEPNESSVQIGTLNLFDMATIIEKTEYLSNINGIENIWYKISFNNVVGYVFGGFGVIINKEYEIKTIDDFANGLSSIFQIEELNRYIFTWRQYNENFMVRLDYSVTFMNHQSVLCIYYRPKEYVDVNEVSEKYNLEIINANNQFGRGDSYRLLNDSRVYSEITTNFGNKGKYFFRDWGIGTSYDIANFLFEMEFDNYFDSILITPLNLWLGGWSPAIRSVDTEFIHEARKNRIKESIIYHIFYEIILRLKIE